MKTFFDLYEEHRKKFKKLKTENDADNLFELEGGEKNEEKDETSSLDELQSMLKKLQEENEKLKEKELREQIKIAEAENKALKEKNGGES